MVAVPSLDLRAVAANRDVQIGDAVHVISHGPAVLVDIANTKNRGRKKYKVKYPNGTFYHVSRQQILQHAPRVEEKLPLPVHSSPRGPRGRLVYLGRAFGDESRQGSLPSATFSLVATMVGGGVLSLPYAMSQCGLIFGSLAMVLAAAVSAWTLDMLVECARCTGRDTFELVGHAAFGECGRRITMALVFVICWLTKIAYFVLLADLLLPLVELAFPSVVHDLGANVVRRLALCGGALLLAPMCFKSNLASLRWSAFASVGSVLFVAIIICIRAAPGIGQSHEVNIVFPDSHAEDVLVGPDLALWPQDWLKALYVFPMFGVSFLCHFNALPTHQELQRPTKHRIRLVFGLTMGFTCVLYLFVAIFGYMFGGSCTCGNILLNFYTTDVLAAASRAALAAVLMLNFPLICQPGRNALFRLLSLVRPAPKPCEAGTSLQPQAEEVKRTVVHVYRKRTVSDGSDPDTLRPFDQFEPKDDTVQGSAGEQSPAQRYALTSLLLGGALLVSLFMRSILVVWAILGSTVAFLVGFILPAACWAEVVGPTSRPFRRRAARILLICVTVLAFACTVLTCFNLDVPPCPVGNQGQAMYF